MLKGGNEFFAAVCASLDVEALQKSFDALVARHAVLRSRFRERRISSADATAEADSGLRPAAVKYFLKEPHINTQAHSRVDVVDCDGHTAEDILKMVEKSCHAPFRCGSGEPGGTESTEASAILRVCVYQNLPSALQRRLPENLTNILVLAAPDIASTNGRSVFFWTTLQCFTVVQARRALLMTPRLMTFSRSLQFHFLWFLRYFNR